jgi:hypothetical protein
MKHQWPVLLAQDADKVDCQIGGDDLRGKFRHCGSCLDYFKDLAARKGLTDLYSIAGRIDNLRFDIRDPAGRKADVKAALERIMLPAKSIR